MTAFSRTLVAMDLSVMDPKLLEWVGVIDAKFGLQKVYFLHVMPDFNTPKNVDIEFHTLFSTDYPADEKVRDRLAEDVEKILGKHAGLDIAIEVREGKPYQKVVHLSDAKEVQLLVIGRKKKSEGSGISARRIARTAKCNVMVIPENSQIGLKHILVPIDFSELSAKALRTALDIAGRCPDVKITALYVMDLPPSNYFDKPYANSGLQKMLRDAAHETFSKFLTEFGDKAPFALEEDIIDNTLNNTARHITNFALLNGIDLIIMGAQGHSTWENLWFGSVTEKVVETAISPVLVIRGS